MSDDMIDFNEHPYLKRDFYEIERAEWENNPEGKDRHGRHHYTFGCLYDWWDRKVYVWRTSPRIALDDAIAFAKKHGGDVWMKEELESMIGVEVDA